MGSRKTALYRKKTRKRKSNRTSFNAGENFHSRKELKVHDLEIDAQSFEEVVDVIMESLSIEILEVEEQIIDNVDKVMSETERKQQAV